MQIKKKLQELVNKKIEEQTKLKNATENLNAATVNNNTLKTKYKDSPQNETLVNSNNYLTLKIFEEKTAADAVKTATEEVKAASDAVKHATEAKETAEKELTATSTAAAATADSAALEEKNAKQLKEYAEQKRQNKIDTWGKSLFNILFSGG